MKKVISFILLSASLLLCLSSCNDRGAVYGNYNEEYDDGYEAGFDEGYGEGLWEGYKEGYSEAYYRFEESALHDAVHYAEDYSGWHPEEAMYIIEAYENGDLAFGYMTVTEKDYKNAVQSLCLYYQYFYDALYYEKMNK